MNSFFFIELLVVLLFFTIPVKSDKYEALTFSNEIPHAIFYMAGAKHAEVQQIYASVATACPANNDEEWNFNENYSLGEKSLFVQKTYAEMQPFSEIEDEICDDSYQISVAYNKITYEFMFGYEIYFKKSENDIDFITTNYGELARVSDSHSMMQYLLSFLYIPKAPQLFLNENTELDFIWINTFRVKYNFWQKLLIQIIYTISKAIREMQQCHHYNLGEDFYKDLDIDKLYFEENQRKILKDVNIPTSDADDVFKHAACNFKYKCFTKWQLIPAEQFRQFPLRTNKSVSCSNLATVPIWKSIAREPLQKLDRYLFAISRVAFENLTIQSGVQGALYLPTGGRLLTRKKIYLNGNDMLVPNIIYKLIKYETKICWLHDGVTDQIYCDRASVAGIVVVHNDPYFLEQEKVCDEDKCEEWGLEVIQFKQSPSGSKSRYVYCCPKNEETIKKLGLTYLNEDSSVKDFSLKSFPIHDYKALKISYEDVKQKVDEIYEKLSESVNYDSDDNKKLKIDLPVEVIGNLDIEAFEKKEPQNKGDEPDEKSLLLEYEGKEDVKNTSKEKKV